MTNKNPLRQRTTPFTGRRLPRRNPGLEQLLQKYSVRFFWTNEAGHIAVRDLASGRYHWYELSSNSYYFLGVTRVLGRGVSRHQAQESKSNPYVYGPTGFRPPKAWWDRIVKGLKKGYKPLPGMTRNAYNTAIARIAGGIWSKHSDATRSKILKEYER